MGNRNHKQGRKRRRVQEVSKQQVTVERTVIPTSSEMSFVHEMELRFNCDVSQLNLTYIFSYVN